MNNNRMTEEIWNDFKEYFPSFSRDTVDFYRSGRFEITVILGGGRRAYYNYLTKNIRFIGMRGDRYSEESFKSYFATALTRKLVDVRMTQRELSEKSGVNQVSISKYINGKSTPSSYVAVRIADALECSVSELIDFDI